MSSSANVSGWTMRCRSRARKKHDIVTRPYFEQLERVRRFLGRIKREMASKYGPSLHDQPGHL